MLEETKAYFKMQRQTISGTGMQRTDQAAGDKSRARSSFKLKRETGKKISQKVLTG